MGPEEKGRVARSYWRLDSQGCAYRSLTSYHKTDALVVYGAPTTFFTKVLTSLTVVQLHIQPISFLGTSAKLIASEADENAR